MPLAAQPSPSVAISPCRPRACKDRASWGHREPLPEHQRPQRLPRSRRGAEVRQGQSAQCTAPADGKQAKPPWRADHEPWGQGRGEGEQGSQGLRVGLPGGYLSRVGLRRGASGRREQPEQRPRGRNVWVWVRNCVAGPSPCLHHALSSQRHGSPGLGTPAQGGPQRRKQERCLGKPRGEGSELAAPSASSRVTPWDSPSCAGTGLLVRTPRLTPRPYP